MVPKWFQMVPKNVRPQMVPNGSKMYVPKWFLKGLIPGENTYKFVLTNNHGKSTEVVKTITYIEK